jgi:phage terminase large subunit GpA-like protein
VNAAAIIHRARARAFAPRKRLTVSEWADAERRLSKKGSAEPGPWRTDRNPILREPMDCMSSTSSVQEAVLVFPVQIGKTEIALNTVGYTMEHYPGPIMVCLPGDVSQKKWINQKLNPMIEETPAVRRVLTSINSRDTRNTLDFKDFLGGQLYIEHAGSTARLKSTTVRLLIVDELTEFVANLLTGDDPLMMLDDRTSSYPATYKHLFISSPGIKGLCRISELYEDSDQRRYYVPCLHCEAEQPLEWSGLHWNPDGSHVRYVCRECGAEIEEYHKTEMIKAGRWVPENPGHKRRGYAVNCLYYQIGLGPRWATLVETWRGCQNDPAKLKTFINSRLAEAWEDPSMRKVKMNAIQDRAESFRLRTVPLGVGSLTAGVDTQDDRLEVQIVGWGKHLAGWTVDYIVLPGDPADDEVWLALTDLLNRPLEHVNGHLMPILATAIDCGGHRTEAVKDYVRQKKIRRPMAIFGAVPNNAPVLSKGKAQDINFRGNYDKRGVMIHHVGTVGIKNKLFGRMATDGDKPQDQRLLHFSEDLPAEFFAGMTSETFNPRTNRFDKKRGIRNEPLDTWVYAYAATHHPELRLHLYTLAKWDGLLARYGAVISADEQRKQSVELNRPPPLVDTNPKKPPPLASDTWSSRL